MTPEELNTRYLYLQANFGHRHALQVLINEVKLDLLTKAHAELSATLAHYRLDAKTYKVVIDALEVIRQIRKTET